MIATWTAIADERTRGILRSDMFAYTVLHGECYVNYYMYW